MHVAITRIAVVLLAGVLATGCLKQTIETTIEPDGSGTNVITIALSKRMADMPGGPGENGNPFGDLDEPPEEIPESWNVRAEEYETAQFIGIRMTTDFQDLAEMKLQIDTLLEGSGLEDNGNGMGGPDPDEMEAMIRNIQIEEQDDGTFTITATGGVAPDEQADEELLPMLQAMAGDMELAWTVTLPQLHDYSPKEIGERDGNTVSYRFDFGDEHAIELRGEFGGTPPTTHGGEDGLDVDQLEDYLEGSWRFNRESLLRYLESRGDPVDMVLPALMQQVQRFDPQEATYTITVGEDEHVHAYEIEERSERSLTLALEGSEPMTVTVLSPDRIKIAWQGPAIEFERIGATGEREEIPKALAWMRGSWTLNVESLREAYRQAEEEPEQPIEAWAETDFFIDDAYVQYASPDPDGEGLRSHSRAYRVVEASAEHVELDVNATQTTTLTFQDRDRVKINAPGLPGPVLLERIPDYPEWLIGQWRIDPQAREALHEHGLDDAMIDQMLSRRLVFDGSSTILLDPDDEDPDPIGYEIVEQDGNTLTVRADDDRDDAVFTFHHRNRITISEPEFLDLDVIRVDHEEFELLENLQGEWEFDKEWLAEHLDDEEELEELQGSGIRIDETFFRLTATEDGVVEEDIADMTPVLESNGTITFRSQYAQTSTVTFQGEDRITVSYNGEVAFVLQRAGVTEREADFDPEEQIIGTWRIDRDWLAEQMRDPDGYVDEEQLRQAMQFSLRFDGEQVTDESGEANAYTVVSKTDDTLVIRVDAEEITIVFEDEDRITVGDEFEPKIFVMIRVEDEEADDDNGEE